MDKELERLQEILSETNPLSADYDLILSRIETILDIKSKYLSGETVAPKSDVPPEPTSPPQPDSTEEDKPKEKKPKKTKSNETTESKEPVETPEEPKAEKPEELTMEFVRAQLSQASSKGVLLQPIIEKFTPEGKKVALSNIPEKSYPDLLKELDLCLKNQDIPS